MMGTFFDSLREQLSDPKAYREKHGTVRDALQPDPAAKEARLRREAEKKDKRAMKMSKKLIGGNWRARSAATTAENLHNQADRASLKEDARRQTAAEAEDRRLEVRRENFRRTGRYDG
jgi:hypothetical protein